MRSVIVHLRDTTEEAVVAFLERAYARHPLMGWVHEGDEKASSLYIDIYRTGRQEFEPEDWMKLVLALGCEPDVSVIADVSGRLPGDKEVAFFVLGFLRESQGIAQDDYSAHYWTKQEIETESRVEGHCFFDYRGSHEKN